MKLVDITSGVVITLPNDLMWEDEFSWSPTTGEVNRSLTGALIIEVAEKQLGRSITLKPKSDDMAWVSRAVVAQLRGWLLPATRKMRLELEYPDDSRQFIVMFRHWDTPVEASPVKGFPGHNSGDLFNLAVQLMEVEA